MLDHWQNKVETLTTEGYDFSASQYLKEGWEIYKDEAFSFIGFLLVTVIISFGVSNIPTIGAPIQYFVVGPALGVGYFIVAHKIRRNEYDDFGEFFKGFSYLKEIIPAAFTLMAIYVLAFSPSIYSMYSTGLFDWYQEVLKDPFNAPQIDSFITGLSTTQIWIVVLNLIPVVYLTVAFSFAYKFIVFCDMGFWEAIESSRKVITRRWFAVFGYYLLFMGLFFLATLLIALILSAAPLLGGLLMGLFMIAVVAISPLIYCGLYAAFADILQLNEDEDSSDDILDHLVD